MTSNLVIKDFGESTEVTITCIVCGKQSTFLLSTDSFNKWRNGTPVQDAMPYLDRDDRELFISGLCNSCFPVNLTRHEKIMKRRNR